MSLLNSTAAKFCLAPALVLLILSASHAETRTWTDSTGKHKVEGDFLEILEGQVKLQRTDGKKVSLPLSKLSKEDQAYLRELVKNRRNGQPEEASPFATEDRVGSGRSNANAARDPVREMMKNRARRPNFDEDEEPDYQVGDQVEVQERGKWELGEIVGFDKDGHTTYVKLESGAMADVHGSFSIRPYDPSLGALAGVSEQELARVDVARIRRVLPLGGSSGDFKPDAATTAKPAWKPRPIGLSPQENFFSHVVGISFAKDGTAAAVGHADRRGSHEGSLSQIEICDLKSGNVVANLRGPRNLERLAISPSGKRLITIGEEETFVSGPLQLWEIAGDELKHLKSWHVNKGDRGEKIEWIGWVDEECVLTVDRNGLTMWSIAGPSGVYHIAGDGLKAPAFSPGGKQFAIGANEAVSIHDVATGEMLARIKLDHGFDRRVAFSPGGDLLSTTGSSTVEIYDIAKGDKIIEAYCGSARSDQGICWLGNEHVLVGGADLIHVPSQMTVWKYEHNAESVEPLAGSVWYVFSSHGNEQIGLLPFQLPHSAVKPVAEKELVLKPGDDVCIELELAIDLGQNAQGQAISAKDELSKSLTEAGFLIADQSPRRLVARSMPGETKEINYRMFGAPFGQTQKSSYTQKIFELELIVDGQPVWKRQRTIEAPHHLQLQENESVDQAVNRAMLADTGFFRSTVPSRVLPTAAEQARTSKLSINGME